MVIRAGLKHLDGGWRTALETACFGQRTLSTKPFLGESDSFFYPAYGFDEVDRRAARETLRPGPLALPMRALQGHDSTRDTAFRRGVWTEKCE